MLVNNRPELGRLATIRKTGTDGCRPFNQKNLIISGIIRKNKVVSKQIENSTAATVPNIYQQTDPITAINVLHVYIVHLPHCPSNPHE